MEQVQEKLICTSIEQSRKLINAGIDPHTADMHYHHSNTRIKSLEWELRTYKPQFFEGDGIKLMERFATATNTFNERMNFKNQPKETAQSYFERTHGKDVPAWSFMGLVKLLPKHVEKDGVRYDLCIKWTDDDDMLYYVSKDHKTLRFGKRVTPDSKDLLDSVVIMLTWLKQLKYM